MNGGRGKGIPGPPHSALVMFWIAGSLAICMGLTAIMISAIAVADLPEWAQLTFSMALVYLTLIGTCCLVIVCEIIYRALREDREARDQA